MSINVTSKVVRVRLEEALRLDLVGPWAGSPHAAEELPEAPSHWYVTGFLVPNEAPPEQKEDPTADEQLDLGIESAAGDDDAVPEKASARRGRLPSSIGISVLVPPGVDRLDATVRWGDYLFVEDAGRGSESARKGTWKRKAREEHVSLTIPAGRKKAPAVEVPGSGGLLLEVMARTLRSGDAADLPAGTRSVSVFLVNARPPMAEEKEDEAKVFQAQVVLNCERSFVPRADAHALSHDDWDEKVADLQFRDAFEFAVGHGVATNAKETNGECLEVETEWIPSSEVERVEPPVIGGVELRMEKLAAMETAAEIQSALLELPKAYGRWIDVNRQVKLAGQRAETTRELMNDAVVVMTRIEDGLTRLSEPDVLTAFRLANRTMAVANRRRTAQILGTEPAAVREPAWRPFQLAFLLMNLDPMVRPGECPDRDTVDLLFFPTGGGKTEAYLGLAAFTLVLRRLKNPGRESGGVSVLMRYTLRLLTLDQLARAAALICALELERLKDEATLGPWPFEIGLWVGRGATPNRMGAKGDQSPEHTARYKTIRYKLNDKKNPPPIPLEACPWCGTRFTKESFRLVPNENRPTDLRVGCRNLKCDFKGDRSLPILTVDEPIYRRLPCFLIATVDKFASLPWVGESGALFGRVSSCDEQGFYGPCVPGGGKALPNGLPAPDLIIQDELHLISGPLGTIAGLFEVAIDTLSTRTVYGKTIRPKVVASTATVRRAKQQIQAFFGRSETMVFPPPGPDRRDSFFARTVPATEKNARLYVGVAAQGRSPKVLLLRSYLALLGAGQKMWEEAGGAAAGKDNPVDPYMTLVGYFNALRELGGSRRIVEDEVKARAARYGARRRTGESEGLFKDREIAVDLVELTSRVSTTEVARAKERLSHPFFSDDRVDVALATNMISVGLDITRLGLMVVLGQPKSTAEYIQATSRVGRDDQRPGLVVTILNIHRPRDRSHLERFEMYHRCFYRAVEATSVTPFAPRAIERVLAAVTVALARLGVAGLTAPGGAGDMPSLQSLMREVPDAVSAWGARHSSALSSAESEALRQKVKALVKDLIDSWDATARTQRSSGVPLVYQRREKGATANSLPLLWDVLDPELASQPTTARKFRAPRSMRDVEPSVGLWVDRLDGGEVALDEEPG
jgi:hypothetical protein